MSLQDESFPHDELLDLEMSPTPLGRFSCSPRLWERQPQHHHHIRQQQQQQQQQQQPHHLSANSGNVSTTTSSSDDQTISSAEYSTEQPQPPIIIITTTSTDERMVKSDQTGMSTQSEQTNQLDNCGGAGGKSFSYNNIHSEYTKRRYKHVESKVGQYIANIRNEDERRRKLKQFQRHHSLPEITVPNVQLAKSKGLQRSETLIGHNINRAALGTDVIDDVNEDLHENEDDEEVDADDNENLTTITSTTISTQSGSGEVSTDDGDRREANKNCKNVKNQSDNCVDRRVYASLLDERDRLQSYTEYQQLKLDEKQCEVTRLRQNVDFLRVRLSIAEDHLKKNQGGRLLTGYGNGSNGSFGGSNSLFGNYGQTVGRQSLQGLLYCAAKSTKATQTENLKSRTSLTPTRILPPTPPPPPPPSPSPLPMDIVKQNKEQPPLLYITPDTPDTNDNLDGEDNVEGCAARNTKSVATIQPMSLNFSKYVDADSGERRKTTTTTTTTIENSTLRRRSNSLANRQKHTQTTNNNLNAIHSEKSQQNSRSSHPSSSDSAIDVEVIELSSSPKPPRRKRYSIERNEFATYASKASSRTLPYSRHDPGTPSPMGIYIERCPNSTALDMSSSSVGEGQSAHNLIENSGLVSVANDRSDRAERRGIGKSLSRRWLHLFGSCIRCTNSRQTEHEQLALQQTYTQIPLLETTFERSCMELRSQ